MEFRILGPVEAYDEGRRIALGGARQRALLALLLLHANEYVPADRLIEQLWADQPMAGARKRLQVTVTRLRKAIGSGQHGGATSPLRTRAHGYELRVAPGELDLECFEGLLSQARGALAAELPEQAAATLCEALAMWRGPPLADVVCEGIPQSEVVRLEEMRAAALEERIEADLALGRHAAVIGDLEALVAEHPLRERPRRQLVLALYRAGRQADALAAYRNTRAVLIGELGIEPSLPLRQLEQAILAQDASLQAPGPPPRAHRLPVPPSRTIGRDDELEEIAQLLGRDDVRLVTLTGPGGVGKTRLALEAARTLEPQLRDGAWFVSLAATASAEHVPGAVAQALGVTLLPGEILEAALPRFLATKQGLLLLDNFEHLLSAAPLVSDLLATCPAMLVLATSREALGLRAEQRYVVDPLGLPQDDVPATVHRAPASALFVERARSHDRTFELDASSATAVAQICRRIDGLPLAIELAAARAGVLGAQELDRRLAGALDALGGGPRDAPARQRTLRATLEWSHQLLSAPEARAFARFAVFARGATIEAAEDVLGADVAVLEGLIEKHLVLRRSGRLLMLETVREYARELLDAGVDAAEARTRHCRHYLALAEQAKPQLFTRGDEQSLRRLDAEVDNLREALAWSIEHDPQDALRLAGVLYGFWDDPGRCEEGLQWIEAALDAAGDGTAICDRAQGLRAQVHLMETMGSFYDAEGLKEVARARAEEALSLSRQAEDPVGIAEGLLALAHLERAASLPHHGRQAMAEEALIYARAAGDDRLLAAALMERACAIPVAEGAAQIEEAAAAMRKIGDPRELAWLWMNLADSALKTGRPDLARPLLDAALRLARSVDDPVQQAFVWCNIAYEALLSGDLERAAIACEEQLMLCRAHPYWLASVGLAGLAAIATRHDDLQRAARLLGAAGTIGPWDGDDDLRVQFEEQFFAPARVRYGDRNWTEALAAGRRLTYEEAINLALSRDSIPARPHGTTS